MKPLTDEDVKRIYMAGWIDSFKSWKKETDLKVEELKKRLLDCPYVKYIKTNEEDGVYDIIDKIFGSFQNHNPLRDSDHKGSRLTMDEVGRENSTNASEVNEATEPDDNSLIRKRHESNSEKRGFVMGRSVSDSGSDNQEICDDPKCGHDKYLHKPKSCALVCPCKKFRSRK